MPWIALIDGITMGGVRSYNSKLTAHDVVH